MSVPIRDTNKSSPVHDNRDEDCLNRLFMLQQTIDQKKLFYANGSKQAGDKCYQREIRLLGALNPIESEILNTKKRVSVDMPLCEKFLDTKNEEWFVIMIEDPKDSKSKVKRLIKMTKTLSDKFDAWGTKIKKWNYVHKGDPDKQIHASYGMLRKTEKLHKDNRENAFVLRLTAKGYCFDIVYDGAKAHIFK